MSELLYELLVKPIKSILDSFLIVISAPIE